MGRNEEQQKRFDYVRQASKELGFPVTAFMDLQGPKIRLGQLQEEMYVLQKGEKLTLTLNLVWEPESVSVSTIRTSMKKYR